MRYILHSRRLIFLAETAKTSKAGSTTIDSQYCPEARATKSPSPPPPQGPEYCVPLFVAWRMVPGEAQRHTPCIRLADAFHLGPLLKKFESGALHVQDPGHVSLRLVASVSLAWRWKNCCSVSLRRLLMGEWVSATDTTLTRRPGAVNVESPRASGDSWQHSTGWL
jgi:hypothetical protein